MISLNDLSSEDKEQLLKQAREAIEQEIVQKNAIAMYNIKKKDYFDSITEEIVKTLNIKDYKQKKYLEEKMKSLIYILYRQEKYGNCFIPQKNNTISSSVEWESFTRIGNTIKDAIIKSINKS